MINPNKVFSASEIETIAGVKRTRLQQWLEKDYFEPSVERASGPGTRNIYSLDDLYRIAAFKQMVESGLSRDTAAKLVKTMIDAVDHGRGHCIIMSTDVGGKTWIYGIHDEDEGPSWDEALKKEFENFKQLFLARQDLYLFNFTKVMDQVDKKIKELI